MKLWFFAYVGYSLAFYYILRKIQAIIPGVRTRKKNGPTSFLALECKHMLRFL